MKILTELINKRIDRLKNEFNNFPAGGGIEKLREHLVLVQAGIRSFINFIDQTNKEEN